jgi:predicted amidohydrolase YtcJ
VKIHPLLPRSLAILIILPLFHAGAAAPEPPSHADLVMRGGAIYTVDAERSWQQAVAVRDGKIVYVGDDGGSAAFTGPDTRVVDLKGRMMLPGLQDVHIHPISGGMEALACDLNGLSDAAAYTAKIKAYAAANPDLPWILGGGWLMSVFGPGAMPARELLDEVVPDRPVLLISSDGHSGWVNSKALQLAGIDRDTPDPEDGRIDRDPVSGEPIGSLQEGAIELLDHVIPPVSDAQRMDGLRYAIRMLNAYGITSIQDAIVEEPDLETYRSLENSGGLSLRVEASLWWERDQGLEQISNMLEHREQFSSGQLRANTVKIMQDGVMENYTAVMLEPYLLEGDVRGIPMVEAEFLKEAVTALDANGFQVHFHAIGDGAIRQSLDAVEAARKANDASDNRHHISHLELIDPEDIPRFAELDVIANFQPLWATADEYIVDLTLPFIGPERARWLYPINSVLESGGMLAFGSDWSVSTANPYHEIEVAVTRKDPENADSAAFIPDERISLRDAIDAFTINAAYTNHLERTTGSIEPGKLADLVVLDQNLFEIPPESISETRAVLTLFEGKPVHGDWEDL